MSRPQEFDVPQLGPAQRGEADRPAGAQARLHPEPPPARGGYLLHSLVLVLLTGSTSAIGYWGYGLQQELEQSQAQLARTTGRLAELEQSLEVTSDSATQSGQTLSGRLETLGKTAEAKYSHFDSEIAKLWTIAYQRNKPKLEALETQLEGQVGQLESQAGQLQSQSAQLANLDQALDDQGEKFAAVVAQRDEQAKRLDALQQRLSENDDKVASLAGLEAGQAEIRGELAQTLDELRRSLAALDTQVRVSEEVQADKLAQQQAAMNHLDNRIAALEKSSGTADISRRVRVNEQAIQAIDGSRRQFSRELLQLRSQLNNLQRRLQ